MAPTTNAAAAPGSVSYVAAALSTDGATITTALTVAYPGIQVSNPTVTATQRFVNYEYRMSAAIDSQRTLTRTRTLTEP